MNSKSEPLGNYLTILTHSLQGVAFQPSKNRAWLFFEDEETQKLVIEVLRGLLSNDGKDARLWKQNEKWQKLKSSRFDYVETPQHYVLSVPYRWEEAQWSDVLSKVAENTNVLKAEIRSQEDLPIKELEFFSEQAFVRKILMESQNKKSEPALTFSHVATFIAQSAEGLLHYKKGDIDTEYLLVPREKAVKDAVLSFIDNMLDIDGDAAMDEDELEVAERIEEVRKANCIGLDHHYAISLPPRIQGIKWGDILSGIGENTTQFEIHDDEQVTDEEVDRKLSEISIELHERKNREPSK